MRCQLDRYDRIVRYHERPPAPPPREGKEAGIPDSAHRALRQLNDEDVLPVPSEDTEGAVADRDAQRPEALQYLLGGFERLEELEALQGTVYGNLAGVNDEDAFGIQAIVNEAGEVVGVASAKLFGELVTAVGFVVINVTLGNVIEPRIMGRALGLSPLVVLISMVFWWWLWGPVGALLSAPLTMMVKIMLANTTDLRWLAIMLGSPSWVEEMQAQWDGARPVEHKSELCVRSEKPAHEVLLGVRATDPPRDPSATPYAIPRSPE